MDILHREVTPIRLIYSAAGVGPMRRRDFLASIAATAISSGAAPPPRKVLLVHGVLGFKKFADVNYFNGVRTCFTNCEFLEPLIDPVGTIFERAGQLES